jgi:proline iminopeptidase
MLFFAPFEWTLYHKHEKEKMKNSLLFILLAGSIYACNQSSKSSDKTETTDPKVTVEEVKTGGSKMIKIDDKYNVWTKKIGEGKIKVLMLHGGPGFSHDYLECFEDFLPKEGMEIYYYDQLGCGNSDKPTDTSLWTIPRYVEEIEQVRKGLGLDNFYLFGHSCGSMLAMEYLDKYQSHIKAAILSNMTASAKSYVTNTAKLKTEILTGKDIATYDSLDKLKAYDKPEYQNLLLTKLYTRVLCRLPLEQWPEPLTRAFRLVNNNIYVQMQGVDEFHITGNIKNWDMWDRLPNIEVPTLVLGARYDEMSVEDMRREGHLIPNSRTYICQNGSHLSMYDDQQNYFTSIIDFLKDVENNKFVPDKK